jgi:predicted PurR-regulated permease PerM
VKGSIKWFLIAGSIMLILLVRIMILVVIALFNLVFTPIISRGPNFTEQGQSIMLEGQKWWEQRFNQEQTQLENIQKQLEDVRKGLDQQQTVQEGTENANDN